MFQNFFLNGSLRFDSDGIATSAMVAGNNYDDNDDDDVDDNDAVDESKNKEDDDGNVPEDLVRDTDADDSESDGNDEVGDVVSILAIENSASSCTKFEHSEKWLAGPRMSNSNETDMSEELIALSLIMGGMPRDINNGSDDALGQTMCYEQSRIRNWEPFGKLP